jgi:hypothetical protein
MATTGSGFGTATGIARRLDVLFTKDATKKRKVYSDGSLLLIPKSGGVGHSGSFSVSLLDSSGKELYKKMLSEDQVKEYLPSHEVTLSLYLIQIEKETEVSVPQLEVEEEAKTNQSVGLNTKKFLPKYQPKRAATPFASHSTGQALSAVPGLPLQIDAALLRVMREHQVSHLPLRSLTHIQIQAANFILTCFLAPPLTPSDDEDGRPRSSAPEQRIRGSILADDMGQRPPLSLA